MKLPPYSITVAVGQWKKHYSTQSSKTFTSFPCSGASSGLQLNSWNHRPHPYFQYYEQCTTPQVRQGFLTATSFMGIIGLGGEAEVHDFPAISLSLCMSSISTCSPSSMPMHSQHHILLIFLLPCSSRMLPLLGTSHHKKYIYIYIRYDMCFIKFKTPFTWNICLCLVESTLLNK